MFFDSISTTGHRSRPLIHLQEEEVVFTTSKTFTDSFSSSCFIYLQLTATYFTGFIFPIKMIYSTVDSINLSKLSIDYVTNDYSFHQINVFNRFRGAHATLITEDVKRKVIFSSMWF
jgi:hypothetical protein